jgi:hypothetical protein
MGAGAAVMAVTAVASTMMSMHGQRRARKARAAEMRRQADFNRNQAERLKRDTRIRQAEIKEDRVVGIDRVEKAQNRQKDLLERKSRVIIADNVTKFAKAGVMFTGSALTLIAEQNFITNEEVETMDLQAELDIRDINRRADRLHSAAERGMISRTEVLDQNSALLRGRISAERSIGRLQAVGTLLGGVSKVAKAGVLYHEMGGTFGSGGGGSTGFSGSTGGGSINSNYGTSPIANA